MPARKKNCKICQASPKIRRIVERAYLKHIAKKDICDYLVEKRVLFTHELAMVTLVRHLEHDNLEVKKLKKKIVKYQEKEKQKKIKKAMTLDQQIKFWVGMNIDVTKLTERDKANLQARWANISVQKERVDKGMELWKDLLFSLAAGKTKTRDFIDSTAKEEVCQELPSP